MLLDELHRVLNLYRVNFVGRKNYYNGKEIKIGGRKYSLLLRFGCYKEGSYIYLNEWCPNNAGHYFENNLDMLFYPNETIIKYVHISLSNLGHSRYTLKMMEDKHIYQYLNWNSEMLNNFINQLKLFLVESI